MVIVIILTAIASFFAGHIFEKWIIMLRLTKFTTSAEEVKIPPRSGKPLTYHYMNKRYQEEMQTMSQHSTAQHSTAQHSTAQHSTAQHSTAQARA